jgi:menaquinone-dependent protoporphyrinogen oxidase
MPVLVAHATKHGSTRGIAERIAERLCAAGLTAEALPVAGVRDFRGYDAVVLGSAIYMFHWLGEARSFARRHRADLAARPLWLFSSGPLGPEPLDKGGRDKLEVSGPRELGELRRDLNPRDHRVFWGAWSRDNRPIGFWERLTYVLPALRAGLPDADFRDWPNIEAWADEIAAELSPAVRGARQASGRGQGSAIPL